MIDAARAAALGFPKLKYAVVERERRWLCDAVPDSRVLWAERITDLYVEGTRLRLREARRLDGSAVMRRLAKKADLDEGRRLITSLYLDETEFALFAMLPGRRLVKVRHHLAAPPGAASLSVDRFEGALAGLILAEAEFDSDADMAAFAAPDFAVREVTADPRYNGGALAGGRLPTSG
jgi:CYTH domain-containing protein